MDWNWKLTSPSLQTCSWLVPAASRLIPGMKQASLNSNIILNQTLGVQHVSNAVSLLVEFTEHNCYRLNLNLRVQGVAEANSHKYVWEQPWSHIGCKIIELSHNLQCSICRCVSQTHNSAWINTRDYGWQTERATKWLPRWCQRNYHAMHSVRTQKAAALPFLSNFYFPPRWRAVRSQKDNRHTKMNTICIFISLNVSY